MQTTAQTFTSRPAPDRAGASIAPALQRAAALEAARGRVHAAARHADPIDLEAAARAYGVVLVRAKLAELAGRVWAPSRAAWRRLLGA